jgi:hypothetical protein
MRIVLIRIVSDGLIMELAREGSTFPWKSVMVAQCLLATMNLSLSSSKEVASLKEEEFPSESIP